MYEVAESGGNLNTILGIGLATVTLAFAHAGIMVDNRIKSNNEEIG